jgi:hypothetical protein
LIACPQCGTAVERVLSAPNLTKSDTSLSTDNLEKHGFTQYRKSGKGPNVISGDSE